ncbi:tetratricopeptide repeat-containing protein, partial [Nitrospinae bacterium AH_259_B05_G02_I21]|nr:tetratricopeptide repeat-containing protein [Nitrospinae bacterium AH_259_B05_G02_I21]
ENYASLLRKTNRAAEAAEMEARAKRIRAGQQSKAASSTASAQEARWKALNTQLIALYQQGKYREAIPVAKEALMVAEQAFGPDHSYVATSLNNLAVLYGKQGQYAEAEPLYKRGLAIREKALGPDDLDVATILENMANLYKETGRDDEAKKQLVRAERIRAGQ